MTRKEFLAHAAFVDDMLADHLAGGLPGANGDEHEIEIDQLDATRDHHALHAFLHDVSNDVAESVYRQLAQAARRG